MSNSFKAFTLIELLVVISIIALLSTMMVVTYSESQEDLILADAHELQATLLKARNLAMGTNRSYGVVFHIENAGDGTVFKNQSVKDLDDESFIGRHWYALIGPDESQFNAQSYGGGTLRKENLPPVALVATNDRDTYSYFALEDYTEAMEKVQIGARRYLSRGVRFLALSDTNELYPGKVHETYPRPWFGYYDNTTNILYPWGAYNPEIDADWVSAGREPGTGLDYQGYDGPVTYNVDQDTNLNPDEVWGRIWHYWDFSGNTLIGSTGVYPGECVEPPSTSNIGTRDKSISKRYKVARDYVGPDRTYLAKKVRPVVNGYWSDFMIIFGPDGSVSVAKGHARALYFNRITVSRDRISSQAGRAYMGMEFDNRTSAVAITLAPDIDAEDELYSEASTIMTGQKAYNKFNSVEDAFESITPFVRVHLNKVDGLSEVRTNDHEELQITADDLLQRDPYPRGIK